MMKLAPVLMSIALLLAACSPAATPAAPATLRQTCESVQALWKGAGESPDYAAMMAKLQAISDAADASSREALAPVLAAARKVTPGDDQSAGELVAAYLPFMAQCAAAGASVPPASSTAAASSSPTAASTPATGCGLVTDDTVEAILSDSGRTAIASASARSGVGPWLVALKLRSGEVGVWVVDSIVEPTLILSAEPTAAKVAGWGMASAEDYGSTAAVEAAKACVA